jgi:hypothetical protein
MNCMLAPEHRVAMNAKIHLIQTKAGLHTIQTIAALQDIGKQIYSSVSVEETTQHTALQFEQKDNYSASETTALQTACT